MELPSYNHQLLRQLYAFCKEQQFCDCSILVGKAHFRAHKLVLAAASLLLKSLLESTDIISVDSSLVAPDDFALLLEMIYTGKVPLGKHNFTKLISVADNLQMFDVAVSCKALLRDLLSCSSQDHAENDLSIQTVGSAISNSSHTTVLNAKLAVDSQHSVRVSSNSADSENNTHSVSFDEESVDEEAILPNFCSQVSEILPGQSTNSHGICEENQSIEPPEVGDTVEGAESPGEEKAAAALLQENKEELVQSVTRLGPIHDLLEKAEENFLPETEKQVILDCCQNSSPKKAMENLIKLVVEEKTLKAESLAKLLIALKASFPDLHLLQNSCGQAADQSDDTARWNLEACGKNLLRCHRATLAKFIVDPQLVQRGLSAVEHIAAGTRELLNIDPQEEASTASWKASLSSALGKTIHANQIRQLLHSTQGLFPDLQPVMQELQQAGLLTVSEGDEADVHQGPVEKESPVEVADHEEFDEPTEDVASKRSFTCKACQKSFHFYHHLQVHEQRCRVSSQKEAPSKDCAKARGSKKELEKCQLATQGSASRKKKKKKKCLPVACDICGREFAHASGMQYHKLTEHFDEKPFSCDKCGAKFAANSTLKNHQRLHSGDRPFVCKHCQIAFSQASALAYHTKKKHAEGKMYACQYCAAVFAQSIELSRHVRTHTGDKPYVCRECGKGFRQANGLSIHLRSFHNIEDPYDCEKCQMSFPTLQEHRGHIHTAHSKEYHPCPTCGKVFSAPSLLERHVVTHVGGKPFSCKICNKAYRQLSGLWYHNRTHHPDIFAAQNHRSSKFSSLRCSSCDKTFLSTAAYRKHAKEEHGGSQPFLCTHCLASFHLQEALQHHVAAEHVIQAEPSLSCGLCGELFSGQAKLEEHREAEHSKVEFAGSQVPTSRIVQVIQAPEEVIAVTESELTGSHVFLTLPDAQGYQGRTELVTVTMEELLDERKLL